MISIKNGELRIEGTRLELTAEFMCIVNSMVNKGIIKPEDMLNLVGLKCIPEEELKKALIDYIDGMEDIGTALHLLSRLS